MTIREEAEEREFSYFSPHASFSSRSREETGMNRPVISGRHTRGTGTGSFTASPSGA